jgi:transcriptional regulator with XRE-family HTH domain
MDLNNFCQYDKKFAFKIIGRLIQRNRELLNKSLDDLSQSLQISPHKLTMIERGINYISQEQLNSCIEELKIQHSELQEAYYIIESNYLIDVFKELDENFPV